MKRIVFSLAILFLVCNISAQTLDSIPHHHVGYYGPYGGGQWENIMQLRDGNVLFVHMEGINMNTTADIVGNDYYKVSRHGAVILDTLFVYDNDPSFFLFTKNPDNDDHIRVGIVHDSTSGGSFLQIFPFDNDLRFDSLNEVFVPLSDTFAYACHEGYLINKQNELVLTYVTPYNREVWNQHFACFGLDGTLKHDTVFLESSLPMNGGYRGLGVFNESPLEYYWYGYNAPNPDGIDQLVCYVLDSLFLYKDSFAIDEPSLDPENPHIKYSLGWSDCLLVDGDDFILGSRYINGTKNGVCLVRYDKHSLEQKNKVFFPSRPMINNSTLGLGACPIGLGMDSEGDLYFSYNTQQPMFTDKGQIAVVKTDADFNVQWERFCLEAEGYYKNGNFMIVLEDGGAAVCGTIWYTPEVFFLILSDDGWAVNESEVSFRPYAYYPNPVRDELHLQYSPDVTPTQIELYDLQGRLVRTQRNGLERLEMNGVPAGTYTMRVTLEGGKVFSDKVVKE